MQNDSKIYSQNRNLSINKESTNIPVKELYNRDKSKYSTIQNSEDEGKLDNNKNKYFYQLLNEDNSLKNNNVNSNIYLNNLQKEKRLSGKNPKIIDTNIFNFDRDSKHNKFITNIKDIEDYSDTYSNYSKKINMNKQIANDDIQNNNKIEDNIKNENKNKPITNDDIHSEKQYLIDIIPNEKENCFFDTCNNFNANGKLSLNNYNKINDYNNNNIKIYESNRTKRVITNSIRKKKKFANSFNNDLKIVKL